jgi:S1-C subfamily serine protease
MSKLSVARQFANSTSMNLRHAAALALVGLRASIRVVRHYTKEIAVALVLAVVAAIAIEQYYKWVRTETMENNRRAVATLTTFDANGHAVEQGTGFFITNNGVLVTAYHVLKGAATIHAHLPSGAYYVFKGIRAADEQNDIAVLQFDATDTPSVRALGDSDKLRIGEEVYAIGTPSGLEGTVSTGTISNPVQEIDDRSYIQFTASISPGSSGGGLFDANGEVIGITAALVAAPNAENLNLAVPINTYRAFLTGTASQLTRESPELYYSLGNLADNKQDWDEAIHYYQKAIALDANYLNAYSGLGGDYFEKHRFDLEVANYLKATELAPKEAENFYWLGTAYEDTGNFDDALAAYQTTLKIQPNHMMPLHDLAILYLAEGKVDDAKELLPRISRLNPGWGNKLAQLIKRTK